MSGQKEVKKKAEEPRFTRDQHLSSANYRLYPDVLMTVLEKDELYTVEEVKVKVKQFLYGTK